MNNELTKTFSDLTISDITALAQTGDLDDTHLATRLAERLTLVCRFELGVITAQESEILATLVEITDQELARI
jgi:hypothetical protein